MKLELHPADIAEARRLNRKLAWMPKFRPRGRLKAMAMQGLLKLMQIGPPAHVRRAGITAEMRRVECGGRRVQVRILWPRGKPKGIYLDIHGGAWIVGNARADDAINARIAADCGVAVVSVDYHLAWDNRLDLCIEDCCTASFWLARNAGRIFGTDRFVIGGESAGAHLAACTLLRLRDAGETSGLAGAVLLYGAFDLAGSPSLRAAGPETLVLHGPSAYRNLLRLTVNSTDEERRQPHFSPLYGDLTGLPPALLFFGALDPLADDTLQMAERWSAANGNARLIVVPEAPHAFNRLPTRMAEKANAYVRNWVVRRLADEPAMRTHRAA